MEAILPPGVTQGMVMELYTLVCYGSWEPFMTVEMSNLVKEC